MWAAISPFGQPKRGAASAWDDDEEDMLAGPVAPERPAAPSSNGAGRSPAALNGGRGGKGAFRSKENGSPVSAVAELMELQPFVEARMGEIRQRERAKVLANEDIFAGVEAWEASRVRVAVRLRPPLEHEKPSPSGEWLLTADPEARSVAVSRDGQLREGETRMFFDASFGPEASQEQVYRSICAPVLRDVMLGHNGTLLCYGQTGTGKTYTMGTGARRLGVRAGVDEEDPAIVGLMPRAIRQLFQEAAKDTQASYEFGMSYVQLYHERFQDLLNLAESQLTLHDSGDRVYIENLSEHRITSAAEALRLVHAGNENRRTAATRMNAVSSRSHVILLISVRRTLSVGGGPTSGSSLADVEAYLRTAQATTGQLVMADLAGSERLKKSGADGDVNLSGEARATNLSLLALGNVVQALADSCVPAEGDATGSHRSTALESGRSISSASVHIPFRDSKLTHLLRDSFGGTAKTTLCICVGPAVDHAQEAVASLKFGQRAMDVQNRVAEHVDSFVDYKVLAAKQQAVLDSLASRIAQVDQFHGAEARLQDLWRMVEKVRPAGVGPPAHGDHQALLTELEGYLDELLQRRGSPEGSATSTFRSDALSVRGAAFTAPTVGTFGQGAPSVAGGAYRRDGGRPRSPVPGRKGRPGTPGSPAGPGPALDGWAPSADMGSIWEVVQRWTGSAKPQEAVQRLEADRAELDALRDVVCQIAHLSHATGATSVRALREVLEAAREGADECGRHTVVEVLEDLTLEHHALTASRSQLRAAAVHARSVAQAAAEAAGEAGADRAAAANAYQRGGDRRQASPARARSADRRGPGAARRPPSPSVPRPPGQLPARSMGAASGARGGPVGVVRVGAAPVRRGTPPSSPHAGQVGRAGINGQGNGAPQLSRTPSDSVATSHEMEIDHLTARAAAMAAAAMPRAWSEGDASVETSQASRSAATSSKPSLQRSFAQRDGGGGGGHQGAISRIALLSPDAAAAAAVRQSPSGRVEEEWSLGEELARAPGHIVRLATSRTLNHPSRGMTAVCHTVRHSEDKRCSRCGQWCARRRH